MMVINRVVIMYVCALVATAAKAQFDTLRVITPHCAGYIAMDEQPCTVTWQGHTYNKVMVRGRGHTFADHPDKQSMRLRFPKEVALLAGGEAKKWTVLAMNEDPTTMRDAVAWFIADRMGMDYIPAHRYAQVVIDNRPQGICLIADQVEVGADRVPVRKGGFLAELDGYADGRFFYTSRNHLAVRLHYPDGYGDDYDEAADRIITFEEALAGVPLTSSSAKCNDWLSMTDTTALVSWFLTTELIANSDTYWSLYFYCRDAKDGIHFGPVWDCDKAFGGDARFTNTECLRTHAFAFNAAWGRAMVTDSRFDAMIAQRWQSIDRRQLLRDIEDYITHLEALLHTDGTPIRQFLRTRFAFLEQEFVK